VFWFDVIFFLFLRITQNKQKGYEIGYSFLRILGFRTCIIGLHCHQQRASINTSTMKYNADITCGSMQIWSSHHAKRAVLSIPREKMTWMRSVYEYIYKTCWSPIIYKKWWPHDAYADPISENRIGTYMQIDPVWLTFFCVCSLDSRRCRGGGHFYLWRDDGWRNPTPTQICRSSYQNSRRRSPLGVFGAGGDILRSGLALHGVLLVPFWQYIYTNRPAWFPTVLAS
jgi:hypothetical protein